MGLLYTWTAGLVVWIVLWALGAKAIDAMLITLALLLIAVVGHIVWPMLPGNRPTAPEQADNPPFT
jgi:hypothetical protein